jgi:UDPglucose 6-dehydrogenase
VFNLSFFGLGYVGLTTAACFTSREFKVICFDTDKENIKLIKTGKVPFYEPDLEKILTKSLDDNLLECTSDKSKAVLESDVTFITVGTPSKSDGSIDLTQVKEASKGIGEALHEKEEWHLVVVKSTVVPGTTENIVKQILEKYSKKHLGSGFGLCFNPEFLREGSAVHDTLTPDRIVIGECDEKSGKKLESIYQIFYGDSLPNLIRTTPVNAELIKYANNAFLAMKISFINMIANLSQKLPKADVEAIAQGIGLDKRIEPQFLRAGAGWGGSCFKKDLDAIKSYGEKLGVRLPLIEATLEINEERPFKVIELVRELLGDLPSKKIGVLGLSFKPDTSDMREAVSIKVINRLLKEGAIVKAYDPAAIDNAKKIFHEKIVYTSSIQECLRDTECTIILTEWDEFKKLKPDAFVKFMKEPVIIDGRRIFNPKIFTDKSRFKAIGLGK